MPPSHLDALLAPSPMLWAQIKPALETADAWFVEVMARFAAFLASPAPPSDLSSPGLIGLAQAANHGARLAAALTALEGELVAARGNDPHGALDRVLRASEARGLFDPSIDRVVAQASSADFNALLAARHHFKDVGASPAHGEFTHRIQWWLLQRAQVLEEVTARPPTASYASIYATISRAQFRAAGNAALGLWDLVFDQIAAPPYDGRSPENLNAALIADHFHAAPALAAFLGTRKLKREQELTGFGGYLGARRAAAPDRVELVTGGEHRSIYRDDEWRRVFPRKNPDGTRPDPISPLEESTS